MAQKRNTSGLRRGGISPEAQTKGLAKAREVAAERHRIPKTARDDPYKAYDEMHERMTRSILRLLKNENDADGVPDHATTERLKEYRQLTEALVNYRERRGADDLAAEFFARLEEHLGTMNLVERSPEDPATLPQSGESPENPE